MRMVLDTLARRLPSAFAGALITISVVVAPAALADETEELRAKFAASDSNQDGKLTVEEAKAGGMRRIVRAFDRIDSDGDGFITVEEIEAMMKSR